MHGDRGGEDPLAADLSGGRFSPAPHAPAAQLAAWMATATLALSEQGVRQGDQEEIDLKAIEKSMDGIPFVQPTTPPFRFAY